MSLRRAKTVLVALTACAAVYAAQASAVGAIETVATYDAYAKATGIAADKFKVPDVGSFLSPAFAFAMLRGRVTDTGMESIELFIHYHDANSWKFFTSALDSEGNSLPVTEIDRQAQGTIGIDEQFSVSLTRPYLEAHKENWLDIRFGGKYGFLTVKLPASYVQAFLDKLTTVEDTVRERMRSPTPVAMQPQPAQSNGADKPKLGVGYFPIDSRFAQVAAMDRPQGVGIARVASDSVAAKAGLKVGDAILAVDGAPVQSSMTGLQEAISGVKPGSLVNMTVWRAGREITVPVQF